MSLRILSALALSLAAGVAVLPLPALAEDLTPVFLEQHGSKLNVAEIDTGNSSSILVEQQSGETGVNVVDSSQTGETNVLAVDQTGGGTYIDAFVDGETAAVNIHQKAGVSGDTSGKDGIDRGVVDGNYFTVYNNGQYSAVQVTDEPPRVGRLGH